MPGDRWDSVYARVGLRSTKNVRTSLILPCDQTLAIDLLRRMHSAYIVGQREEFGHFLNRQSSSEWACLGHVYRPSVYTVGSHVDCIQLSSYNLIIRLWILLHRDTRPTLF